MAEIIGIKGADKVMADIAHLPNLVSRALRKSYGRIGRLVLPVAKDYCPESPTMGTLSKTLKRKRRTSSRRTPGSLKRSISYEVLDRGCSVFVATNPDSRVKKYARRIHDEKGKTWRNRGPGTVAKGPQADEKFIERAIRDREPKTDKRLETEGGQTRLEKRNGRRDAREDRRRRLPLHAHSASSCERRYSCARDRPSTDSRPPTASASSERATVYDSPPRRCVKTSSKAPG